MFMPIELSPGAALGGLGDDGVLGAPCIARHQVEAELVVELRGGHRARELRTSEEVADIGVGLEQDRRGKEDVVNTDDALFVQFHVVEKGRAAVQGEIQGVVQVVVEIGAGADDEVDQPALHQLDDAAAQPGRRQRPGDGQADGRVVLGGQHLVGVDVAGFGKAPRVDGLEAAVNQLTDVGAARRPVVSNLLALEELTRSVARRSGRPVRHSVRIAPSDR
jgi:hypothetical protein